MFTLVYDKYEKSGSTGILPVYMCPLASIYMFMWGVYVVWVEIDDCSFSVKILKFVTQKTRVSHTSGNNTRVIKPGYVSRVKKSLSKQYIKSLTLCVTI